MKNGPTNVKIAQNNHNIFRSLAIDILWKSIFVLGVSIEKPPIYVHTFLNALYTVKHIVKSTRAVR